MTFPDEDLDVRVEAAFGADLTQAPSTWTWTDLTARLRPTTITIRRGVAVGAASAQISSGTVVLDNDDGALTPMRASSPHWPYVDAGTPARIRVRPRSTPLLTDTFTRTSTGGWGTSTSANVWATGNPSYFDVAGGLGTITFTGTNTVVTSTPMSLRDVDVTYDASVSVPAAGIAHAIGPLVRYSADNQNALWVSMEFLVGGGVQVKVWKLVNGSYSGAGQAVVPGLTYTPGVMLRARVQVVDDRVRARVWAVAGTQPAVWHLDVANTAVTGTGRFGMQAVVYSGSTTTYPVVYGVDNLTVEQAPQSRLQGYICDVKPTFRPGGGTTYSEVVLEIGGIGSRLEKNQSPAYSPMRRSIQLAAVAPIAYWPLEDGEGATYGVSAFPGGSKMLVNGPATFGYASGIPPEQYLTRYGTLPMVSIATGARLTAAVPVSQVVNQWSVDITAQLFVPEVPGVTEIRVLEWHTPGGTHNRWALVATDDGYDVRAYHATTLATATVISTSTGTFDRMITFEVDATQSGANINLNLYTNSGLFASGTLTGSTQGAVSKVVVNPDRANTTASVTPRGLRFVVGHVRVNDNTGGTGTPFYFDNDRGGILVRADLAWYLESAHKRVRRLCDEENVPCLVLGDVDAAGYTALAAQQDGSFTELLSAAAEAESGGLLYEDGFGYAYLPRTARYNQDPTLVIDLATYARDGGTDPGDVLVPQLDARKANVWTVEKTDGATGTYAAPAALRSRRGSIAQQVTLDVLRDTDTDDHAAWRVHLNVDSTDADYPSVLVDLAANPDLIADYQACTIGSRVRRDNQPDVAGTGAIEQVIEGIVEQFGPRTWTATLTASPATVWNIAVYDDTSSRYDTAGCVTTEDLDETETGITVTTTSGPPWAPTSLRPAAVPFDVRIGGERMTVTDVAGTGAAQTMTVVRSVNNIVKTHVTGAAVGLADRSYYGL